MSDDAHPWDGHADDEDVVRRLGSMADAYDGDRYDELPRSFWDTRFAQAALERLDRDGQERIATIRSYRP